MNMGLQIEVGKNSAPKVGSLPAPPTHLVQDLSAGHAEEGTILPRGLGDQVVEGLVTG